MSRWLKIPLLVLAILAASILLTLLLLNPLDRQYALRLIRMGESDVGDYRRFPARTIPGGAAAQPLPVALHPQWFEQIAYRQNGALKQSPLDTLMTATHTQALVVIKDGVVVHEGYYNGAARDSIVTSFSSAKSFNSALIGIAIDRGLIASVDDPFVKYLPELRGRGLDAMTIRDLLMMSSGIDYREDENLFPLLGAPFSDDALTYYYPDLRNLVSWRVRAGDEAVGVLFHYNNYHPILEGMILERVTGMRVADFLGEAIWSKLGAEYPATWSMDSDKSAFEKMESGINARAMDLARFGLLFLQQGEWQGEQIVSREWVSESTSPDPNDQRAWFWGQEMRDQGGYYRYHWWGLQRPDGHYDYSAAGNFGQYIYVCQQKNLVIARFGDSEEGIDSFWDVFYSIEQNVR